MMEPQIPLPFSPHAHENHCVNTERRVTGSEPGSKLTLILLPWSGLVRNSLPGLNAHDIQVLQSREIITDKGSEFYKFFF